VLPAYQGMREVDGDVQVQSVARRNLVFRVAVPMHERSANGEIVRPAAVWRNSRGHQRRQKRLCAAVSDGRFRPIQLDIQVIDERTRDRCQNVFHGMQGSVSFAELGAPVRQYRDVSRGGHPLPPPVGANERDPGSRGRRSEYQPAALAQMKSNSLDPRFTGDRASTGDHSRSASKRSSRLIMPASLNSAAEARNDSR